MKSFKFRIYPSKAQEKEMRNHLWLAKNLWNEMLAHCKQTYADFGYFPTKNTLQLMVKDYGLFSQTQQEVCHRVHDAVMRFLKFRKQGRKCGFPRFKSIDRMKSLHYPQFGFSLEKKLRVSPFGEVSIKKHREIEGRIKTLSLKREPSGKWFAIFCAETPGKQSKNNEGGIVGIDLGLRNFAVLSNGNIIKNPRHTKNYEEKLAFFQRRFSRKVKGSRNRLKARLKVARLHGKVTNTRLDFLHKTSTSLVCSYSLIALEALASQEMAEKNFGKQIHDASWNTFANMLAYKAEEAGCRIVFVDPRYTTQECSGCGAIVPKELKDRTHACTGCGLVLDRDLNSARNILNRGIQSIPRNLLHQEQADRATAGTAGSNASGNGTSVPSMKEEASAFMRR